MCLSCSLPRELGQNRPLESEKKKQREGNRHGGGGIVTSEQLCVNNVFL